MHWEEETIKNILISILINLFYIDLDIWKGYLVAGEKQLVERPVEKLAQIFLYKGRPYYLEGWSWSL